MSYKEPSDLSSVTGTLPIPNGGTGQTAKAAAFDALHPMTTTGDLIAATSGATSGRLPVGTTNQVLKVVGGVPSWAAAAAGGINYMSSNPDAETDTSGYTSAHNTAAAAVPDSGFVAGATTTWTRSLVSPLRGVASFLLTKDAANRQGEMSYFPITIDAADQGQVLSVTGNYKVTSGTYADGDVQVWIWDVTNAVAIQPAAFKILNATVAQQFQCTFQTATNSTSYRILFFVASTSALAYTVQFDNLSCSPQVKSYGPFISDLQSYPPTFVGFGTPTSVNVQSCRQGDRLYLRGTFVTGTATATPASMTLGYGGANNNVTGDSTKMSTGTHLVGHGAISGFGATFFEVDVLWTSSTNLIQFGIQQSTTSSLTPANGNTFGSSVTVEFFAELPITGWSSSQLLSSDADTRVVGFYADTSVTAMTANVTNANFTNVGKDTNGAYSAGVYTITVPGLYDIKTSVYAASGTPTVSIYINGVLIIQGTVGSSSTPAIAAGLRQLSAGDTVAVRIDSTLTLAGGAGLGRFSVYKISGPSQIAASESVSAKYQLNSAMTPSTTQPIRYDVKVYDSHSAVTTGAAWRFFAPNSGKFRVTASSYNNGGASTSMDLYKNGTIAETLVFSIAAADARQGSTTIQLLAGEYIDVRFGTAVATGTTPSVHFINIERVGN